MRPRVLLADDHTVVLQGLVGLLAGHVDLVGTAEDGRMLVEAARRLKPDIVILDISMPGMNGLEAARRLRQEVPDSKLIFLTMYGDGLYVDEAMQIGASGYVLKNSAVSELMTAIQAVQNGKTYTTPLLGRPAGKRRGEASGSGVLTSRQREVLQLVAEGRSAKEIAGRLRISVKTAEFHKAAITRKLGLHTTAELVKYAIRRGITSE